MRADICFIGPAVPCNLDGISYQAMVNGERVACQFSGDLLTDICPPARHLPPLERFENSKDQLLALAEQKIRANGVDDGVISLSVDDL